MLATLVESIAVGKTFNVYRQLSSHEILQEPMMVVRSVRCTPYIIGDATYPI
jgi:hypothetical protein